MPVSSILAICLGGVSAAGAYPIPPRPLRLLVHEAEFIVTARVRAADPGTEKRLLAAELGARGVVVLEIDGLVKGDPGVALIEQVNHGGFCPSPARYVTEKR